MESLLTRLRSESASTATRENRAASTFGDLVVVTFLLMQCLDGVFTFVGVGIWGRAIEANPLVSAVMSTVGVVAAVAGAKALAIGLGMLLHLRQVHSVLAGLTAFYFAVAILPWTALLLGN